MIYIIAASKISSFLFVRKRDSPYKSISLLTLLQKTQNRLKQILHYLYDQNDTEKNDGSAWGNLLYLQSPNYKNIGDSSGLKNYV